MPPCAQVTLTVPEDAPPGTLLSVPVKGGVEQIKIRVPTGVGAGSTLILTQAEGDEWGMEVGVMVPISSSAANGTYQAVSEHRASEQARPPTTGSYQPVEVPAPSLDSVVAHTVRLDTTVGVIDIIVRPDWAPLGTRRFLELAAGGDLADLAFYRAIKGCIVQFGLPAKRSWPCIEDDPQTGVPFLLGAVSFAAIGENTRRSTLFICIGDMSHMLGQKSWETPIGAVAESSLDVLERIDTTYGDIAEFGGTGPDTNRINTEGNVYLAGGFPKLSYIRSAWEVASTEQEETHQNPVSQAARAATEARQHAADAAMALTEVQHAHYVAQAKRALESAQTAAQEAHAAAERAKAAEAAQLALGVKATIAEKLAQQVIGSRQTTAAGTSTTVEHHHDRGDLAPVDVPIEVKQCRQSMIPAGAPSPGAVNLMPTAHSSQVAGAPMPSGAHNSLGASSTTGGSVLGGAARLGGAPGQCALNPPYAQGGGSLQTGVQVAGAPASQLGGVPVPGGAHMASQGPYAPQALGAPKPGGMQGAPVPQVAAMGVQPVPGAAHPVPQVGAPQCNAQLGASMKFVSQPSAYNPPGAVFPPSAHPALQGSMHGAPSPASWR